MFAAVVYLLCACASLVCAVMLVRAWYRSRSRLLFWSAWCFVVLSVNNALLVVDKLILPTEVDLTGVRLSTELVALLLLVFGLIWEEQ